MKATVTHFFHEQTGTLSYVVSDPRRARAAVIDPVLGFSVVSGRTDRTPLDGVAEHLRQNDLELDWILETHAHADHLSGAQALRREFGGRLAIGRGIERVQQHFAKVYNLPASRFEAPAFDRLFDDGDTFPVGELEFTVMHTPGHTSDSVTYVVGDAAFVGDTLFNPARGSARCDFPGGDAGLLFDSIQKILSLPADTRLFLCHDYPDDGERPCWQTTVAAQRADNVHVGGGVDRDTFIARRSARDAELSLPALLLPSIQVNMLGGRLPPADDNGVSYLRLPIDLL